ncbi:MAG: DUF86 domain-containing protein [Methanosarcinales archaeon]|nr:MAG: DUF86 domain-containing protein [Methanosarcinales archaeon]
MQRDREYLTDILESAKIALDYVVGMDKNEFLGDLQCQDAVIRRLGIMGEAARRISIKTHEDYPDLPWSDLIGMRNIMIHEYDVVDRHIVWETVHCDLTSLIDTIENILQRPE